MLHCALVAQARHELVAKLQIGAIPVHCESVVH